MAKLTDMEKAAFLRLAQAPPLRQPPPPVLPFDRYLAALSELTRHTASEKKPPRGQQWKL
jgi:hypothetical protein